MTRRQWNAVNAGMSAVLSLTFALQMLIGSAMGDASLGLGGVIGCAIALLLGSGFASLLCKQDSLWHSVTLNLFMITLSNVTVALGVVVAIKSWDFVLPVFVLGSAWLFELKPGGAGWRQWLGRMIVATPGLSVLFALYYSIRFSRNPRYAHGN